jgi:hypothetical protein
MNDMKTVHLTLETADRLDPDGDLLPPDSPAQSDLVWAGWR